jgi:putative flippase GtrA
MLKPSFATQYILGATIIARVISSLFNYQFNRKIVFRKRQNIEQPLALLRFYLLVAFQMMMSGLLTTFVFQHSLLNEVVSKIIIDTLLFFINFLVQREWVFAYRKGMTR